jgi:hypothetical protein
MSKKAKLRMKKEIKNFWLASSLAIAALLVGAIFQLNSYIHQNSFLSDSQKKIASISSENDVLEAKLSQTNSLENFNQYQIAQVNNYEKVDISTVRYVHVPKGELAKN